MSPRPPTRRAALITLSLACMAWGISFVFIKDVDGVLDTMGWSRSLAASWTVTVRFLLSGILLLPWLLRGGFRADLLRDALWLALPSATGYALQAAGIRRYSAQARSGVNGV